MLDMAKASKTKKSAKSVYTMHEAKTNLSKLVEQVQNGEMVIIANGKKPVAKLVPIDGPAASPQHLRTLPASRFRAHFSSRPRPITLVP